MTSKAIVRLYMFFATENDQALILRRSGIKMYNLIGWNRATDTFIEGQWLKKSVRAEECGLSPDGMHFIYGVLNAYPHTRATSNYTVVSKTPWFTALALHPQGDSWDSGGHFLDNNLYRISGISGVDDVIGRADGLHQVVDGEVTKDCRTGLRLLNGQSAPLSRTLRDQLLDGVAPPRDTAFDHYEAQAGRLYRRRGIDLELIRDFSDMEPRFMAAPYSDNVPEEEASDWYPLDHGAE